MNLNLLTMSGAVSVSIGGFAQSLDVWAFRNETREMLFRLSIALGEVDARMADILAGARASLKVLDNVVRMIAVLMVNVKAFGHGAVMLLPKPNVVRLAVAVFQSFTLWGLKCLEGIASSAEALPVKRAQAARGDDEFTAVNAANAARGAARDRSDLCFERVASSLKAVVMNSAVISARGFSSAIGNRACFSHGVILED